MQKRRALSDEDRKTFSRKICDTLSSLDEFKNAKCIFSYKASFDEADPDYLSTEGKTFCYPISYAGGIMDVRIPASENGWEEGKFGILSPNKENSVLVKPEEIDLVIVPCVGFDEQKKRLGHGKGYYDRYLPQCVNAKKIAIAFEAQKLDEVVTDQYDVEMTHVVTENAIY